MTPCYGLTCRILFQRAPSAQPRLRPTCSHMKLTFQLRPCVAMDIPMQSNIPAAPANQARGGGQHGFEWCKLGASMTCRKDVGGYCMANIQSSVPALGRCYILLEYSPPSAPQPKCTVRVRSRSLKFSSCGGARRVPGCELRHGRARECLQQHCGTRRHRRLYDGLCMMVLTALTHQGSTSLWKWAGGPPAGGPATCPSVTGRVTPTLRRVARPCLLHSTISGLARAYFVVLNTSTSRRGNRGWRCRWRRLCHL